MRVLVTGASGFIGCHLATALIHQGHEVRAFARSTSKLESALAPFDVDVPDVVIGDVTDPATVGSAVDGVDAVIHTANVYSYDPRQAKTMMRTNVEGTRVVLDAALAIGCDPVVHVSTAQISWPRTDDPESPPLSPPQRMPYSDSKKRAEAVARSWQKKGKPVVITYPGGVLGPNDPGPGEQITLLRAALVPTAPFAIDGGFPACDIDWITTVHLGLLEKGTGPRRVTCTGEYVTWEGWFRVARELTGRPMPRLLPTPHWLLASSATAMDALQRIVPSRLPFGREPGWVLENSYSHPDEEARRIAGPPPPIEESLARTIRWAAEAGYLTQAQAGDLAPSVS